MEIKQVPAHVNNYGVGRLNNKIEYIVMHWIVGTLESCDATFQNPKRKASSHYGIGDTDIHQYVKEENTAWHASNLLINRKSIGIEHEGGWENPAGSGKRVKPSQLTHETSAKLVAMLSKKYNIPLDRTHVIKHSEVLGAATSCCGTLDVDLIIDMAKKINAEENLDWERILKKRLEDDAWNMLTEFENLKKLGLITRDDSIQTQTQKWLKYDSDIREAFEDAKDIERDRIALALGIDLDLVSAEFDFANWKATQMSSSKSSFIQELINWLLQRK